MTLEIGFLLALVAGTLFALVRDKASPDVVSFGAFAVLLLVPVPHSAGGWSPLLTEQQAFRVFANPAVVTVAALFIVAEALVRTGAVDRLGALLTPVSGKGEVATLLTLLVPVFVLSAFLNNTPVVLLFVPIALRLADERGIKPSRLLMPLSFASLLGGMCTLIGTSTNILVHSLAVDHGLPGISMFELAWIGLPVAAVGFAYLLIFRRMVPERETPTTLMKDAQPREYLLEVVITEGSRYIGNGITSTRFAGRDTVHVLELVRGGEEIRETLESVVLQARDRLLVLGPAELAKEVRADPGLRFPQGVTEPEERGAVLFEGVIGPGSPLVNQTLRSLRFRQRFGVAVLAVHRSGQSVRASLSSLHFRVGDIILMMGSNASLQKLQEEPGFLVLGAVKAPRVRHEKATIAISIAAAVIILAAANLAPISVLAVGAVVALLLTRCLFTPKVYQAVHWDLIFLIYGMLGLGLAMESTGTSAWLANLLLKPAAAYGPHAVLSAVLLMTVLLTSILTNSAAVVLMLPLALAAGAGAGADLHPFVMAVALGGSTSFATPISYQTNTYVFGIGGYKFADFVKVGLPLSVIVWLMGTFLIPRIWPF
jgi:di/tricarboxylate transporter